MSGRTLARVAALHEPLSRLRVRTRLLLLGLMALALAGVPAAMQWREAQREIGQAELETRGIAPIRQLLELVRLAQQHRGLSAQVLAGDASADAARAAGQARLDAAFEAMNPVIEQVVDGALLRAEWLEAQSGWSALRQRLAHGEALAGESYASHGTLIVRLRAMVDRLAHQHALSLDPERDTHLLTEVALFLLPELTEALGRARARGVAVLAAGGGQDLSEARVYGQSARSVDARLMRAMQEFMALRPATWARLAEPMREALVRSEAALRSVESWQRVGAPNEAATRYFETFTEAIDSLVVFDHAVLVELQGLLAERVHERQRAVATMFGAMLVLLALGVWLGLRIGRSITRQIGAEPADIVTLTEAVSRGRLDTEIVVEPGAERSILAAMAKMQRDLRSSELRCADLIENMPLGVLIVHGQQVRFANAMAAQMRASSVDEIVGDSLALWVRADDRPRVHALLADTVPDGQGPTVMEVWMLRRDGEQRHWRLRVQPIEWEGRSARLVTLGDITEHTLAERRHRELSSIVEQTSDAIMLAGADGRIQYVNPGFERLTGYHSDEVLGRTPAMLRSGAHDEHFYRQLWQTIRAGRTFHAKVVNRRKDGSTYHAIKTITPMFDAQGQLVSFVNIDKDFSDEHATQERLAQLALHDPLTGLANRALLEDHVRETIARDHRAPAPFALLFMDLDGFKAVNDRKGHQAGDLVLKEVARRLQALTREMDIVARLGGDEFVLLLQGVADFEMAAKIADKLVQAIKVPIETEAGPARVGGSIGIAVYPRDGNDAQALLQQADAAMYRAKRAGGSRIHGADATAEPAEQRPQQASPQLAA